MHDDLARSHALRRDPVEGGVLAQGRDEHLSGCHTFLLHAEDVHDVRLGGVADVARHIAPECLDPTGQERRRRDQRRARADETECLDERARDARVQHVAHDRHVQTFETSKCSFHRVQVEEGLGRVLVLAVPRVHDMGVRVS